MQMLETLMVSCAHVGTIVAKKIEEMLIRFRVNYMVGPNQHDMTMMRWNFVHSLDEYQW